MTLREESGRGVFLQNDIREAERISERCFSFLKRNPAITNMQSKRPCLNQRIVPGTEQEPSCAANILTKLLMLPIRKRKMMFSHFFSVLFLALTVTVHGQAARQHENVVKHVRTNQDDRDLFWLRYLEDLGGSVPSNDGKGGTGKGVFSKKKKKGSMGKGEVDKAGMAMGEGGKGMAMGEGGKAGKKKTKENKKGVKGDKKQKKEKGGKAGGMGGKGDSNDSATPTAAPTEETKVKKKSKGSTASPSAVPSAAPSAFPTASSKGKGGKGKRM